RSGRRAAEQNPPCRRRRALDLRARSLHHRARAAARARNARRRSRRPVHRAGGRRHHRSSTRLRSPMNTARSLALALFVLGLMSSGSRIGAAAQDQPPAEIASEALAQIDALMAEKDSRTPDEQKIDSQLIYERRMESGQSVADGIWFVETDLPYADDGHL